MVIFTALSEPLEPIRVQCNLSAASVRAFNSKALAFFRRTIFELFS
jgi:hypothetical protein